MKVGIYGATGYGGMQLIALLKKHQDVDIVFISSNRFSGKLFSEIYPKFSGQIDMMLINEGESMEKLEFVDLIFLALPHGISMKYVEKIRAYSKKIKIIDLSGDYRIQDVKTYEKWYGFKHTSKDMIKDFIYGLPEIFRDEISSSNYVANPGCFPTSMILPLYPILKNNFSEGKIIVDSKTGVSGAGRKASESFLFTEIQDNTYAYKTGTHRHSPEVVEILRELTENKIDFLFSPHIVPSSRGIYSTIYVNLKDQVTIKDIEKAFFECYGNEYFIEIVKHIPSTKDVNRSNKVFISYYYDERSKILILYSAIDNLMKGAASQAIQNMNIMYGLDEKKAIDFDLYYI